MDNVPLLVSLYTDATPDTIRQMVGVFRGYGEVENELNNERFLIIQLCDYYYYYYYYYYSLFFLLLYNYHENHMNYLYIIKFISTGGAQHRQRI